MGQVHVVAVLLVLHVLAVIGARLVVEALVLGVDLDPRAAGHREGAHEGALEVRHLDAEPQAARLGLVAHVPDLGAQAHEHLDGVAGVAGGAAGVDHVHAVEVALHLQVVLVAAAGKHDALAGADALFGAVVVHHGADDLAVGVYDHVGERTVVVDLDVVAGLGGQGEAAPHAAVLKGTASLTHVARAADEVGASEVRELGHELAPGEGAARHVTDLVAHGAHGTLDPVDLAGELVAHPVEVLLGDGVGLEAGGHVGLERVEVIRRRNDDRLARGDGVAAGLGLVHLLDHEAHNQKVALTVKTGVLAFGQSNRSNGSKAGRRGTHGRPLEHAAPRTNCLHR